MSAVSMVGNSLVALMSTLTTDPFSKLFGSLLFSDLLELPAFFWHILSPISWDPRWWQHRTPQGTIYVLLKFRIGCNLSFSVGLWCHGFTLESVIDVGQEINVGPGKYVKKNKRRALNKHRARTKWVKLCYKKTIKRENICRPWKKFQNLINVGPLIRL